MTPKSYFNQKVYMSKKAYYAETQTVWGAIAFNRHVSRVTGNVSSEYYGYVYTGGKNFIKVQGFAYEGQQITWRFVEKMKLQEDARFELYPASWDKKGY